MIFCRNIRLQGGAAYIYSKAIEIADIFAHPWEWEAKSRFSYTIYVSVHIHAFLQLIFYWFNHWKRKYNWVIFDKYKHKSSRIRSLFFEEFTANPSRWYGSSNKIMPVLFELCPFPIKSLRHGILDWSSLLLFYKWRTIQKSWITKTEKESATTDRKFS